MIIDLDAHQGNGYERDFMYDDLTFIVDMFNPMIYPNDSYAQKAVRCFIPVYSSDSPQQYINKMKETIP